MPVYSRKLSKGLRYFYKFDLNGTKFKSKAVFLSKEDAKKAEADIYSKQAKQISSNKTIVYLFDIINERLDNLMIQKSKGYYKESQRYYKKLYDYFGNKPITEIKKSEIQTLLLKTSAKQQKEGKDNYVVNAMLRNFKALFNFAIDTYELDIKNPCYKLKFYPVKIDLKYIPPDEDIKAVKDICDPKQRLLIDFLMETGARINEALNLIGRYVNKDSITLFTRKSKNSNLTPRKLNRPDCFAGMSFKPNERIFCEWKSQPKFLQRKQMKLKQQTWGFHSLRHRRASLWSKEGKPLLEIMVLLGHSQLSTTQNYLQLLP